MDLKDLNKQQLILLALLVSFITSIATGIVTVTLMDQAPPGVTQTINRVVRETVQVVTPPESRERDTVMETIVIKEEDFIVDAAAKNNSNVVRIGTLSQQDGFRIGGIGITSGTSAFKESNGSGFVVSSDGLLVTDKEFVRADKQYAIQLHNGDVFGADVIAHGEHLALLQITIPPNTSGTSTPSLPEFSDITLSDSDKIKIGQTVLALGVDKDISLLLGVVSRVEKKEAEKVKALYTTIVFAPPYSGGPLINTKAEIIGINIATQEGDRFAAPTREIKNLLEEHYATLGNGDDDVAQSGRDSGVGRQEQTAAAGQAK